MNRAAEQHLAKAEGYFAKGNAWYAKAADEIIAAKEADTTLGNREIGVWFKKSDRWVRTIVTWRTTASPETPVDWERGSHATTAEIKTGAEKLLRDAPEAIEEILENLPDDAVGRIEKIVADETVKRTVYADRPKPKFKDVKRKVAAKDAARLKENPDQAVSAFVASLGRGRAQIRSICQGYQDLFALVQDEEWREYARELLVSFQTNINLALGEVLEGSLDDALARLLAEEEVK